MLVVGLTGGVGMGKSTLAEFLRERGEPVIDTDAIAREVVAPGSDGLAEVLRRFGPEFSAEDGSLNRQKLAEEVFNAPERRKLLESILHPRIRARWKEQVASARAEGRPRAVVVIPLLFETGAEKELDRTVCVACSDGVQMTRLRARGWTAEEAKKRVAAQWPATRKMDLSDGVIWNDSTLEICREQAMRLFD